MKTTIGYYIVYIILCNVIMFIFCVLPWYGTFTVNPWFALLAIPGTTVASFICNMLYLDINDNIAEREEDAAFDYYD